MTTPRETIGAIRYDLEQAELNVLDGRSGDAVEYLTSIETRLQALERFLVEMRERDAELRAAGRRR